MDKDSKEDDSLQGNSSHPSSDNAIASKSALEDVRAKASVKGKIVLSENQRSIIIGVISSVAASLILLLGSWFANIIGEYSRSYSNAQSIYIDSQKEWIDSKFGPATYTRKFFDYEKDIYVTKPLVVTVYYDNNQICKGYYVTKREDSLFSIYMSKRYDFIMGYKPLGKCSFYDIEGTPQSIEGNFTNGSARTYYEESYHYASSGDYYIFSFAVLDIGDRRNSFPDEIDDSKEKDIELSDIDNIPIFNVGNRKKAYPNTYGIFDMGWFSEDKVFDSYSLDAYQLTTREES